MAAMKLRSCASGTLQNGRVSLRPTPTGTRLITYRSNEQINAKPTIVLKNHPPSSVYNQRGIKRSSESGDDDSFISHSPMSEDLEEFNAYAGQSMSKNAILARENRQKKKRYINSLESTVRATKEENAQLKANIRDKDSMIAALENEVFYLKSVVANVGEVSKLVRVLRVNGNVLSTSLKSPTKTPSTSVDSLAIPRPAKKLKLQPNPEPVEAKPSKDDKNDVLLDILDTLFPETPAADQEPNWLSHPFPEMHHMDDPSLDLLQDFNHTDLDSLEASTDAIEELTPALPFDETLPKAGICLHVCNSRVSLEFCASCCQNARDSWNAQDNQDPH